MFERAKKNEQNVKSPKKKTTFGNDSDDEVIEDEIPNVEDLLKDMDNEIKVAKQNEKNATIARVYSTSKQEQKQIKTFDACGCFSGK